MRIKINRKTKYSAALLMILTFSSILVLFPINFINPERSSILERSSELNQPSLSGTMPYTWWNGDWRFRVQLTTSLVVYAKMDVHVYTTVNFTDYMEKAGAASETFDVNSIRLVEYLDEDMFWETPYKINSSDPQDPEKIQLVWILNGTTPKETSRMFYIYFDTVEYGPKTAPTYETLFSGTRAQYENNQLVIDDLTNWYSWNDPTTQLTHDLSLSSTDGTYIAGNNAFRSNGNDHFDTWALINNPPFNYSVGIDPDQIRYIDVWWYYMDSDADISLQIQDDGAWAKRWGFDCDSTFTGYDWPREGNYVNQDQQKWRFYRLDLINQLNMAEDSWITGLAFSADNGDVIYDHIMFEKYNTTNISLSDEPEKKTAEVTIITKDVDGQIISGAEVYLLNVSATEPIVKNGITDSQGQIVFDNVSYGVYDIIVNYSLITGLTKNVYNSSNLGVNHNIDILYPRIYLKLDLWTLDFKVQDYDHKALSLGYINIKESSGGQSLVNLSLDENGWQKFVWLNRSDYYYEAYYRNDDYNPIDTLIDKGTVSRKTELINSTTINVNNTNIFSGQPEYKVDEAFLVSGTNMTGPSTYEIGTQTIISANISLQNMQDNLTSVRIWYVDENGYDDGSAYLLESKTYITETTSDFLSYNLTGVKEAYGLRIEIIGQNQTRCNGTITVSFTETQTIDIKANMSSMEIYITDSTTGSPVSEVIVRITNATSGISIVDLITSYGYAKDNNGNPFWYLRGDYNITLYFFGAYKLFNITSGTKTIGNKTIILNTYTTQNVEIGLDPSQYLSAFNDTVGDDQNVIWGANMYFQVNFTASDNGGSTWTPISTAATVTYYIKTLANQILFTGSMDEPSILNGNYSKTINSSILIANNNYKVVIFGKANGYLEPTPETFFITINPIPTQLSVFNYVSQTNYTSNEESEYWGEAINFTVFYYREGYFDAKLKDATISYEWNFGSGPILQDPLKPEGYYYFELKTSDSPNVGKYQIKISAQLQNYTTIADFDFFFEILTRPTYINGKDTLEYISKNVYIEDAYNFTFAYTDILKNNELIGDLDVAAFTWNKLDDDGIPLNGTEYSGIGTLLQNPNNSYTLDFDTETREVGEYSIFIILFKSNYEVRNTLVSLRIIKRAITISFSATGLSGSQINVVQGTSVAFNLTLYDPTNGNQLLTGADLTLKIGTNEYSLTEVQEGVYTFTFSTENIEAFFTPITLQGLITIEKENYNTGTIQLSIIIGMPEIFPGFPIFYFLIIVVGVAAVVGSLVTYRQIQRARIPTFVKKVRAMNKNIKGKKIISDSLLYPSKEQYIIKKLGDKWEMLGLSLEDIYGLEGKKRKKLPDIPESEGGVM